MYDLHLHLDGSLTPADLMKAAMEQGIDLGIKSLREAEKRLIYNSEGRSLTEYLKCFELPLRVLQTPMAVRFAVMKLLESLKADGVDYAEIRFAPQLHTGSGYSQDQIVQAAVEGLDYADMLGISAKLILCLMRGEGNFRANEETIDVCGKFLGRGVCALDLAGDESRFKTECFRELFVYAAKKNIPFTIHAGEADGPESIESALRFGAKRIGHGIALSQDKSLLKYVIDNEIGIEMCPTSNFQTGAAESIEGYPLFDFIKQGVLVTINTDNRTVSSTNMRREFELIKAFPGYDEYMKMALINNSRKIRFR